MPKYNPDAPASIRAVFDLEADQLNREGFTLPFDLRVFADDARGEQPDELAPPVAGALRGDVPLSSNDKEIK